MRNRERYGIRICNVSCGGRLRGLVPLRRPLAGRREGDPRGDPRRRGRGEPRPRGGAPGPSPASAPSVLTVGGLDDKNRLHRAGHDIYHGSYGPTIDGLQKPEVIAPAIWLAAPILPGTPTATEARLYTLPRDGARRRAGRRPRGPRRSRRRPRRGAAPRAAARPAARRGEAARQQRHQRRLQARRRHELRRADRLLARRADARGEPGPPPARGQVDPRRRRRSGSPTSRSTVRAGASSSPRRPSRKRSRGPATGRPPDGPSPT